MLAPSCSPRATERPRCNARRHTRCRALLFAKDQVQCPAAANVRAGAAEVEDKVMRAFSRAVAGHTKDVLAGVLYAVAVALDEADVMGTL